MTRTREAVTGKSADPGRIDLARLIVESAGDAIIAIDAHRRIHFFNAAAEVMFRCAASEAIGQPVARFIPESPRGARGEGLGASALTGSTARHSGGRCTLTGRRADGETLSIEAAISQVQTAGGTLRIAVLRDTTESRRAAEAIRSLAGIIEVSTDSMFITDREGCFEYVNPAFEALTGYRRGEVLGKSPRILRSGKHDRRFYDRLWGTIQSGRGFYAVFVNRRKDGSLFHEEEAITPITDGRGTVTNYMSAGRDISVRVRAEEQLLRSQQQLRALAARLQTVQEEERARIARALHDELGQVLTGFKYDLAWLARALPADKLALGEKTRGMLAQVDGTIGTIRRMFTELRPSLLDELGLEAAVEWHAREFQARTGIACHVASHLADPTVEPPHATALFRILQEALTNVACHARASRVRITLKAEAENYHLSVQDNGRGVAEAEIADKQSLGFLGMRERARLLGGEVVIAGAPGKGTTVRVRLPRAAPCLPEVGGSGRKLHLMPGGTP